MERREMPRGGSAHVALAAAGSIAGGTGCGGGGAGASPAPPPGSVAAMRRAIAEARLARHPFGAALLDPASGLVVWVARNSTDGGDPTAHAEVETLRGAGVAGLDPSALWLVTTAESCPMCAAAEVWAGVRGVVYGTPIRALIDFGWAQIDLSQREIMARSRFNDIPIVGDFLREETDPLYAPGPPR